METDFVSWYVVCVVTNLKEDAYGVVDANQLFTGYANHEHRLRSDILADLNRGVGYATAQVIREGDGSAKVVRGARIHAVRAPKGDGHWITTNPNDTTRDNLGNLPWCDQVVQEP